MASLKDVEKLTDELEKLVGELRSESQNSGDFDRLVEIADQISEQADGLAGTFSTMNEALMSRIDEAGGNKRRRSSGSSGSSGKSSGSTSSSSSGSSEGSSGSSGSSSRSSSSRSTSKSGSK